MDGLLKTPLWSEHKKLGARLVPFAGYDMPVQYSGVIQEHEAVRKAAGLFDVAHMGLLKIEGPGTKDFLNFVGTRDISALKDGEGAYSLLCLENGGTVDDFILYCENKEKFWLVLNASNKEKDLAHLQKFAASQTQWKDLHFQDFFATHSLLALQGPKTAEVLRAAGLSADDEAKLAKNFSYFSSKLGVIPLQIAVTGYTGESGCEIIVSNENAVALWHHLFKAGANLGLKPCGLAARDTLRTEMGYSLYGHELLESINPIEAGLSWAVSFQKEFVGKNALLLAKTEPRRKLVSLKNDSKQAPRPEMKVFDGQRTEIGWITSGTFAPSLGHAIGLALVDARATEPYFVQIRDQLVPFQKCSRPFYKKTERKL